MKGTPREMAGDGGGKEGLKETVEPKGRMAWEKERATWECKGMMQKTANQNSTEEEGR